MKIALKEELGNLNLTSDLITSCVKMNKQFDYQKVPSVKNENKVLDFLRHLWDQNDIFNIKNFCKPKRKIKVQYKCEELLN